MENKKKIVVLGTLVLFSTALLLQEDVSFANDTIYSPVDPNQEVKPVAPSDVPEEKTTESSVPVVRTESSSKEQPKAKKQTPKKETEKKTMKRKKLYLDEAFFTNDFNHQAIALNGGSSGGGQGHSEAQLTETLKLLSGVAIYGRRK